MALILSRAKYTQCPVGCIDCSGSKSGNNPCGACGYEATIAFDHYKEKGRYVLTCRTQLKNNGGVSEDAAGYYDAEDWQKAEKGDADSMFRLGHLFSKGTGVPQDDQLAAWWYEKAASNGCTDALTALGQAYYNGLGVSKDDQLAKRLLMQAFKGFSPAAGCLLGLMELDSADTAQALPRATRFFRQSAKLDDASGQAWYAKMLLLGGGVERDVETGMFWLKMSMSNGEGLAWGMMGDLFLGKMDGVSVGELNKEKARDCYHKAASKGALDYMVELAKMLITAEGGAQDIPNALGWLNDAAEQQHVPAYIELAGFYSQGQYTAPDWPQAKAWAKKGSDENDNECTRILAFCHLDEPETNPKQYLHYLNKAAKNGDIGACHLLKIEYETGTFVAKDDSLVAFWKDKYDEYRAANA